MQSCRLVRIGELEEESRRQEKNYTRLDKIEVRKGGTFKEVFTVKCVFLYDIYGIVRVEYCIRIL